MHHAFLGVGNPLRQDDGVGLWIGRRLAAHGWTVYLAGTTPENIVGKIQRDRPHTLLIVDAAELDLPPGTVRRLPVHAAPAMLTSTHGLPLPFLLSLLQDSVRNLVLVGVQPALLEPGEGLTPAVKAAAELLLSTLAWGELDSIPLHNPSATHVDRAALQGED